MKLIIRVGGSVVASPFDPKLINTYVDLLLNLKRQGHVVGAVIGGGSLSRELINTAKAMGLNEKAQDEVAILVSRLTAQLFVLKLGKNGTLTVPTTIEVAAKFFEKGKIVVMGGLKPGMTTDSVAAMLSERVNANLLVKASNVDGVYTKDPKKYKDAEKLERLSFNNLRGLFEKEKHEAGINQVIDPEAVHILQKNKIKTLVVDGFKPENVLLAVKGEKVGTLIS
jgi:uridylate kinase